MGRWDKKKPKNYAPQTSEEAESLSVNNNIDEVLAGVAESIGESAGESVDAAAGADPKPLPSLDDVSAGFDSASHGKDYSSHPKFDKFKNHKGSK